jgi:hypothetical protein
VPVPEIVVAPGPGLASEPSPADPVSAVMATPHRLLEPVRA